MKRVLKYCSILMLLSSCSSELRLPKWYEPYKSYSPTIPCEEKPRNIDIIENIRSFSVNKDKRGKEIINSEDTIHSSRDSIYAVFEVESINKLKYSYQIVDSELQYKKAYKINLICKTDTMGLKNAYCPVIIIDNVENDTMLKIKIGQEYKMLLISYFCNDYMYSGMTKNAFIDNVYILFICMNGFNLYTTPNLQGLYYR